MMAPSEDVSDVLAEELMTEMAGSFFGDRRRMEARLAVLDQLVEELRRRGKSVDDHARLFHRSTTTPEKGRELLRKLGITSDAFPPEAGVPSNVLPERLPTAFTPRGGYVKLVETAYEGLRKASVGYMGEMETDSPGENQDEGVSYRLIEAIVHLLNEEIAALNRNRSPSQVLHAAKRFRTRDPTREAVTGGGGNFADGFGLDQGMAFSPVRLEDYDLRTFPRLPELETARPVVQRFATKIYNHRREMAVSSLRAIRQAIRSARREARE